MPLQTLHLQDEAIELDRASAADLPAIVALLADDKIAAGRGDSADPADLDHYRAAFTMIDNDPSELLIVARKGAEIVGTLQLSFLPGLSRRGALRLQIEAVRVGRSQRGSGLGSAMINWSLDEGRRRGATMAQLTSDSARPDAHRFYSKLGFSDSHVGFKIDLADRKVD
ncbi:GNAT family N-acetyltransferase [Microlunatus soli]|uniref:Acetyltransferase (GNAT) family protein n=1 Tax=Microlunatus soli TaxID=630515 RepID=A0A1H1PUT6_9ACTN|nr:GNAT family N-acetyltransferase [Microlunatus soli]SDS14950.1 Acetyltransferase (GNAT) family protein [Microlunatus soli]